MSDEMIKVARALAFDLCGVLAFIGALYMLIFQHDASLAAVLSGLAGVYLGVRTNSNGP